MTTYEVVVATDLMEDSLNILRFSEDIELSIITPNLQSLREKLATAHALISRDDVTVDAELLKGAPNLKVIGRVGASLSGVDVEAATDRGIIVTNTPGVNAIAAAEHTFALILALSRRLVTAHNSLREGFWLLDRRRQTGSQLNGKVLGIIGLGRVGRQVAQMGVGFGMSVLAYDPYLGDELVGDSRVSLVGLRELLSRSDYVSLHIPPTRQAKGMVNAEFINQMKTGARLINTSHGSIAIEDALAEALKNNKLAGVAVDVFEHEPPYNSPLIGMENVVHTPHIGDNTVEAAQDLSIQIVHQVVDALRGEDFRNVINMPFMPGMDFDTAQPYMTLAERMGGILHTLARSPIRRLAVEYRGEDTNALIKPITVAMLKGVLNPILAGHVNYINAPVLAGERGIQVTQAKGLQGSSYSSIVLCQATLEDDEDITIAGTLMDREPHIVQINDYRMNFVPEGHLLIMGSYDYPGVIGKVGTLLSENGINIASWQTGRTYQGGHTLTVLTLDEPAPDAVVDILRQLEFIRHAHQVINS